MKRYRSGYTIVEVMIVIAITGVLFTSAVLVFHGTQDRVSFSQAMQDASSYIQNYVSQISAGSYPDLENYSCSTASGYPHLTPGSSGNNQECLRLGRAFVVQPGSGSIGSYIILGDRTIQNGGSTPGTEQTSTIEQADPHPAMDSNGMISQLISNYTLESGSTVLSSTVTPSGGGAVKGDNLVDIYSTIGTASSSSVNGTSVGLLGAPIPPGNSPNSVEECIEGDGDVGACCITLNPKCPAITIPMISQWTICIQGGNNQTAELEVNATGDGVTTKLNFVSCS